MRAAITPKAVEDLGCEKAQLKFEQLPHGPYYVEGCGRIGRYWAPCNPNGLCAAVQGGVVSDMVLRQAAFDLKCDQAAVTLTRLDADTFGARGCEKQASYLLVGCDKAGGCRVIQNTQTQ